jgi:hypothetical protein
MNILKFIAGAALLYLPFNLPAVELQFQAANNSLETRLCVAAVTDNLVRLRSYVYRYERTPRFVARHIDCNGQNITAFALKYGAETTGKMLHRFNPKVGEVSITDIAALNQGNVIMVKATTAI